MKHILLLMVISVFLFSCSKNEIEEENQNPFSCLDQELEIIEADNCCGLDPNPNQYDPCEFLIVEEVNEIDEQNYSWIPEACLEIGDSIIFESFYREASLTLVDKKHYISNEQVIVFCSFHELTLIEQKNEIVSLEFVSKFFHSDTILIELKSIVNSYENQTPGPKIDMYKLELINSKIDLTIHMNNIKHEWAERWGSRTFHESIKYDGIVYNDVIGFIADIPSIANPNLPPSPFPFSFFVNGEVGIIGLSDERHFWWKKQL